MRYIFLSVLFFLCCVANGQDHKLFDTITYPAIALQKLHALLKTDRSNPELLNQIASRKMQLEEYDSCIFYCNKSIEMLTRIKNDKLFIRALHLKGNAQYYLEDKTKAEGNWRQALQLAIHENEYEPITKIASNLGGLYLDEVYIKGKNIQTFTIADSFLIIAYRKQKAKDSLGSEQGLRTMRLMATSMHLQKKYDSADHYYKKVIQLSKKKNINTYLGALTFYAELLSETGRHAQALAYAKEAVDFSITTGVTSKDKTHIMHVYGNILFKTDHFKEAYTFIDSAYKLLSSDYGKVNAQSYADSESRFKNQLLQYQIELERQKKNKLYYFIGGLVLLTVIAGLWLQVRNNKRMATEKIMQKQISIDAFIEGEEKEKIRLGRELHEGIAQEIVGVKLAMQQQNADIKLIEELSRISVDIRNISHELMPQTLKEFGLTVAVEDVCQKILGPSGIQYEINSTLADERLVNKIEITLYRVFQELVHNIIKHSQATEVLVQLRKMNNHILLVIEDNGQGMIPLKKNGIGILNLKARLQLLDGSLQYELNEHEGTTSIVRVPIV